MELELHELPQEYCDREEKNRKFTYHTSKNEFVFYLFDKRKDVSILDKLKVFDKLYEKYNLKSSNWTKFSGGYLPPENVIFDSTFGIRIIKLQK